MNTENNFQNDLLDGANAIGNFLGLTNRQVYHAVESGQLPVVRLGTKILARRSTLLKWFEAQEQQAFDTLERRPPALPKAA